MNKGSIIVSNDNIAGEIIIEKQPGNDIIVNESNITRVIRNNKPTIIEFNNYNEIVNKIKQIIGSMCFSSRYSGMDMYDHKYYDNYDPNIINNYIYGIESLYNIPNGSVLYHKSNNILFECTNIEFMMLENVISFKYTNINIKNIYLVERSNGDIQNACLLNNGGVFFKNGILKIQNTFSSNKDEEINYSVLNDLQKTVNLEEFLKLNNIKLEITLPYFTDEIIDSFKEDTIIQELLRYYNNKMMDYSNKIEKYIIKK